MSKRTVPIRCTEGNNAIYLAQIVPNRELCNYFLSSLQPSTKEFSVCLSCLGDITTILPSEATKSISTSSQSLTVNMAGHKRKKADDDNSHSPSCHSDVEQQIEKALKMHQDITEKVKSFSSTIGVVFEKYADKEPIVVHRDLLSLHSPFFEKYTRFQNTHDGVFEGHVILSQYIISSYFEHFLSWMNTGALLPVDKHISAWDQYVGIWMVGRAFKLPAFQNMCMDALRQYCKSGEGIESCCSSPKKTTEDWGQIAKESPMRSFFRDCLRFSNRFMKLEENEEEYREGSKLLRNYKTQDLAIELALGSRKDWKGTRPWDDKHRATYMLEEVPLDEIWEKQTLTHLLRKTSNESKSQMEEAAAESQNGQMAPENEEQLEESGAESYSGEMVT
ncbi:hypothetical protein G7Y89_g6672 [Cudoniella acicularis]|uniref:BTB domain-containing protein n=1 Tax=Cudoniella acicularis TaxID=354080 RepID=A0A8H4W4I9_9HELO|nr:hypothetical protein G7Y89_g6672 [Cudoniella acicularis]